ncbi:hypothetical protein DIPPA_33395 [Diplonema papillatum]|nr:hypothetical protein DIPPA_33395 [Diplonema papillatum]
MSKDAWQDWWDGSARKPPERRRMIKGSMQDVVRELDDTFRPVNTRGAAGGVKTRRLHAWRLVAHFLSHASPSAQDAKRVLSALRRQRSTAAVEAVFDNLERQRAAPQRPRVQRRFDADCYGLVLQGFAASGLVEKMESTVAAMQRGPLPMPLTRTGYLAFMRCHAVLEDMEACFEWYDRYRDAGYPPSSASALYLMRSCREVEPCLFLLRSLTDPGATAAGETPHPVLPSLKHYAAAVRVCSRAGAEALAEQLFAEAIRSTRVVGGAGGRPSGLLVNELLRVYKVTLNVAKALPLMSCDSAAALPEEAPAQVDRSSGGDARPFVTTAEGERVHFDVLPPDTVMVTIMLDLVSAKALVTRQWQHWLKVADAVWYQARLLRLCTSPSIYAALMTLYAEASAAAAAERLLEEYQAHRMPYSEELVRQYARALWRGGDKKRAEAAHAAMTEQRRVFVLPREGGHLTARSA